MKRILGASFFVGALALSWTLAGCGNNQEQTATPVGNAPTTGTGANATDNTTSMPTTGATLGTQQLAGSFAVMLMTEPKEPKVGDARFQVKVTQSGKPVTNAAVKLDLSMPAMNMGGPGVTLKHSGGGVYTGTTDLNMGGAYEAKVTVSAGGRASGATYNFTASQ